MSDKFLVEYTKHKVLSDSQKVRVKEEMSRKEIIELLNNGMVTVWSVENTITKGVK